ncbi:MAG TPA: right-handed parallel beta-helix repeat-containing protein [Chloroflexota bacterium]|jgi:CSLREA domain-containing protein
MRLSTRVARCWGGIISTLGLLLGLLGPATPAAAASFVVTSTTDAAQTSGANGNCTSTLAGGVCTLRAAIQAASYLAANGQPRPHAIFLQAAGTYLLTLGQLSIDSVSLGIENTSGGSIAIDGNHAVRVFAVGLAGTAQVTMAGVTTRNGAAFDGAGVLVAAGSTLALLNATVSGNKSTLSGSSPGLGGIVGGGIRVDSSATVTLINSTVSGNSTEAIGGGIYSDGTLTLTDSTVSGNSALDTTGLHTICNGCGGGIFVDGGTATLTNATISGNSAVNQGGGIVGFGSSSTVTLSNSTVSGNSAADVGGGISSSSGMLALSNTTISGNSAIRGGGLFNVGTATLTNATVSGNSATALVLQP